MTPLHSTTLLVYLVVRGDVESHSVLSAHLSPDHAEKSALERMKADEDNWRGCSVENGEVRAWERCRDERGFNGRLFGYFAIESFELQDEGNWTCTYEPPSEVTA